MCQLLCLTTHDPDKRNEIIARTWKAMWDNNQKDGFGAAWFSPDGEIGYFKSRYHTLPNRNIPSFIQPGFKDSNDIPSDGGFLIIHGRVATNQINVDNTHPMFDFDAQGNIISALIHNGVVRSTKYKCQNTSCDSELLLMAYANGGIEEVVAEVTGGYAFMLLNKNDAGDKTLHVYKDDRQPLVGGVYGDGFALASNNGLLGMIGAEVIGDVKEHTLMVFSSQNEFVDSYHKAKPIVYNPTGHTSHYRGHTQYQYPTNNPTQTIDHKALDAELAKMRAEGESYAG